MCLVSFEPVGSAESDGDIVATIGQGYGET